MGKRTFHRDEPYEGYENQNVKNLKEQISILEEMKEAAEKAIEEIQSNCDHHYQFSSGGMYEDNYVCKHCGHDTEN